ncbi:MAG TPA: hypothetical protein VFD70_18270 [Anaerolineae bacterium]|nr:hypothetical protein [Anaerolineae bacterium]
MLQKWEYCIVEWIWNQNGIQFFLPDGRRQVLSGSYAEVVQLLTGFGRDGWEIAGVTATGNWVFFTLKRPIG